MRIVKEKWAARKYGRELGNGSGIFLTNLRFADDILLVARTLPQLKQMIADVCVDSAKVGLELHPDKTKIQHNGIGYGSGVEMAPVMDMKIQVLGPTISNMYLGRSLCMTSPHDAELDHRVRKAWAKFGVFKNELTDKEIPLHLRMKLFHSVVSPTALYGCCSWVMTSARRLKLRRTQLKMMRLILCRRRTYNADGALETWVDCLQRVTGEARLAAEEHSIPNWAEIQTERLESWNTRLQQMNGERWAKQLLEWCPDGRRSRGRPSARWADELSHNGT
jgi:hypothetical protein